MLIDLSHYVCRALLTPKAFAKRSLSQSNAGFTAIEVIVVVLMIGILAAVAVPSWIGFTNRQRVNAVNDVVLRALQQAQQEAKSKKLSYSVSFKTDNQVPQIAIHPNSIAASALSKDNWKPAGADLEIKSGQVLLGTNLSAENTASSSLTYASSTPQTITFNYMGNLPRRAELGSKGLIVSVAAPQSGNSTQALDGTRRCVIVQTLLGAMRTAKGTDCNFNDSVNSRTPS